MFVQLARHDWFALTLAPRIPPDGLDCACVPVAKHEDWQFAYWELQVIMQVVVTELCASLIFSCAAALAANPAIANAANRVVQPRMIASLFRDRSPR
jgi:hypothetical protein